MNTKSRKTIKRSLSRSPHSVRKGKAGVTAFEYQEDVLTHPVVACGPVPTALDPDGVYPYVSYCETANRPVPRRYTFVSIENRHIKVTICPDLGGKITSLIHKGSAKEVLYVPQVVRPARILPRFYFVAGGIEVSFPISHSPSQNEKVLYRIDRRKDRVYVTCGERELHFGMHWSVEYSLGSADAFLTERLVLHNPGTETHPWMSWSNAALPSAPDTEFHFPSGKVLSHSSRLETIEWPDGSPRREEDISEMTGFFWMTRDANAFGAFTPSFGTGLYHVADQRSAPGMKLWSYGVGEDRSWATLGTASEQPYIEIQGGPIPDQSVKLELAPGETRWHVEYWIPSDRSLDIYSLNLPAIALRSIDDVPLFSWARSENTRVWEQLVLAHRRKSRLPTPPAVEENLWAPSGMDSLGPTFKWAIKNAKGAASDPWKFHCGGWLAGRNQTADAARVLADCELGVAKVLLARIYRSQGEATRASDVLDAISEPWIQLHPQVMVERDKALHALGKRALVKRQRWLDRVAALRDEEIIERRVQLLIDQGQMQAARDLLLSISFQKVHQRYIRTDLWRQICEKLGQPFEPIPRSLGEDRLARFGAYREFE
jgi:uncharacterized protein DUF5107/uncharacterized protein